MKYEISLKLMSTIPDKPVERVVIDLQLSVSLFTLFFLERKQC